LFYGLIEAIEALIPGGPVCLAWVHVIDGVRVMANTAIDWTAVATAAAALLAVGASGWATVKTIKSNERSISNQLEAQAEQNRKQLKAQAEQNRKQQLADIMSTALGYFTGRSQNRGVGIAALSLIQADAADLTKEGILTGDELKLYRSSIRELLYGQLLFLYLYGENRAKAHEAANMLAMSRSLFSDYFDELKSEQKAVLYKAMEKYEEYAKNSADEPVVDDLLRSVPAWKGQIQASP
jgi:hypothetical protein